MSKKNIYDIGAYFVVMGFLMVIILLTIGMFLLFEKEPESVTKYGKWHMSSSGQNYKVVCWKGEEKQIIRAGNGIYSRELNRECKDV